jgi:murein endopeptidase
VDENFLEKVQPIKVDFQHMGFKLSCGVEFSAGAACSACGTGDTGCH